MVTTKAEQFHALLIGIDNYEEQPLSGCVNDIDQMQSILTSQLAVPTECIRRLEAPTDPIKKSAVGAERLPSFVNLVAALQELASDKVQHGDRVFIYYSGHGSYEKLPMAESYFEGLAPLDYENSGLLFDVELNQLLQDIADRSGDLSVVLDCCYSAGATRQADSGPKDSQNRFLRPALVKSAQAAISSARMQKLGLSTLARQAPEEYTVVAACHADEVASECRAPAQGGTMHGLLSYSLFETLRKFEPAVLAHLRWCDIWEHLKAAVNNVKPTQRPMLLGRKERRIFGGPWLPQDTGYAIKRSSDGSYHIAAGRLAGLGKGAQIAVYGPEPARFPPLNSEADKQARLGVLVVDNIQPDQAKAWPSPSGSPAFDIPAASRGRLIQHGEPDLLHVALSRKLDPEVQRILADKAHGDRFVLLAEDDPSAECRVGQYPNGDLWIGDDLFGPGTPTDKRSPGPMGRVSRTEGVEAGDRAVGLLAGLNHYRQYVIPLRACRNGGFTLPEQAVEVRVLDCTDMASPLQLERDASVRREARRDNQRWRYVIGNGTPVAFHVHNMLSANLYVFLLLCNLEGQIEFLDGDVTINAHSGKIFWHQNIVGNPFELVSPNSHGWGIDRLVVIATDQKGMDLSVLGQELTMNEAIREAINTRSVRSTAKNPPGLRWTAVQTLIQIGAPEETGM